MVHFAVALQKKKKSLPNVGCLCYSPANFTAKSRGEWIGEFSQ
jgi:hypothetical protein